MMKTKETDIKYYTPTIDEFHVGFEYQLRNELGKDEWSTYTFDDKFLQLYYPKNFDTIESEIRDNNIRVKYLDREDIESLGFPINEWFINEHKYGGTYKITFRDVYTNPRISIHMKSFIRDGSGNYEVVDIVNDICIKNKSELKKLMKQLNIEWEPM